MRGEGEAVHVGVVRVGAPVLRLLGGLARVPDGQALRGFRGIRQGRGMEGCMFISCMGGKGHYMYMMCTHTRSSLAYTLCYARLLTLSSETEPKRCGCSRCQATSSTTSSCAYIYDQKGRGKLISRAWMGERTTSDRSSHHPFLQFHTHPQTHPVNDPVLHHPPLLPPAQVPEADAAVVRPREEPPLRVGAPAEAVALAQVAPMILCCVFVGGCGWVYAYACVRRHVGTHALWRRMRIYIKKINA